MHVKQTAEPIFNVPLVVLALLAAMGLVHAAREVLLTHDEDVEFLLTFAFIPGRYETSLLTAGFPGGWGAEVWTFVTYAFIHANLMHIVLNGITLLAFGSAVARRFGATRFLAFFVATATAGALAHLFTHPGELIFMVGASGAISGFMAAAARFAFQAGGPLGRIPPAGGDEAYRVPAASLGEALRDRRIVAFLGVWFGLNILFGLGSVPIPGLEQTVAWQVHIGGFLAGLVLFALFDPVGTAADAGGSGDGTAVPPFTES
jgi:membrane associated rhomboid family serine protease